MISQEELKAAQDKFNKIIEEQLTRIDAMKSEGDFIDYSKKDHIEIGVVGGDGIGPFITKEAQRVLEFLLKKDIESNRVTIRNIDGLTIENRAACHKAIPDDVLAELKECDVILKGPTTTPRKGDKWPNIESANVAMRKELDLFANLRPVKIPEEGVDWTFFRENTEGGYAVGSEGVNVNDDLAIDFTVTTQPGSERIIRAAFDYAQKSGKKKVTVVTKANVIKTTDGKFLDTAKEIAKEYPDVEMDDWYIDIMTAKLVDPKRRQQFKVVVLPNLYGDIITDEAAELQGGVGTAGSANIGKKHAMFEAIHGSAPRMVDEGRAQYADPSSIVKAAGMLLDYIGYTEEAEKLSKALQICSEYEKKVVLTGRSDGGTGEEFANYLMETLSRDDLEEYYSSFNK
ncbi:MAG: isocitrate/isopropylmalate dehydrogenase family protein [Eubacteriaceae bacterium]|mgnify:CR=1 FL=1|jgi:isocitrate dehydrogenase (NAD+)|uniref:Isocitrate/isopropylmalate dehydrogenase family protein n=1 Tax=Candidatus Pseudoramibacter fermentans TaxID=2594427 RepID=A0A6L5GRQ5_9FIRM|nr:isocitrate/isopropylmalate dehydrogenase family protein [Candidatus Pseudoramibacter fermentans]RRF93814.1 MAG: isocitrate/isopropylmalate dehydrogenase family protein [Eubacteriaceae bacterium]